MSGTVVYDIIIKGMVDSGIAKAIAEISARAATMAKEVNAAEAALNRWPLRWGLLPGWARDPKLAQRMINARAETLAEKLRARGFSAAAISGDIVQTQRERTIGHLRDGKLDILVATDVAARGLDLPDLGLVIHADLPTNKATLLHRSGRTARAGDKGTVVTLALPHQRKTMERQLKAFELRLQGLTYEEIGRRMGINYVTAYHHVATRLQQLEDELAEKVPQVRKVQPASPATRVRPAPADPSHRSRRSRGW